MRRFVIDPKSIHEGVVELSKEESHHALAVFRLKGGDVVELFDGQGKSFEGVVVGQKQGRVSVMVNRNKAAQTTGAEITLAVSVIKPERMELLIEKACELGVAAIQPLHTERSVVKLSAERWESKLKRWQKIALESCKQCGRAQAPRVLAPVPFEHFVRTADFDLKLIPTLAVASKPLHTVLDRGAQTRGAAVLIGPEGDFSGREAESAVAAGFQAVSLGPLVLRSETAALYVLSVLNFNFSQNPSKAI